jgi:hypothetical protein
VVAPAEPTLRPLDALAAAIRGVFATGPISRVQLANVDQLALRLEDEGAHVIRASQYGDRIAHADDRRILAENTTAAFWTADELVVAGSGSFEAGHPHRGRCFVFRGPASIDAVLAGYYSQGRRVLFDVDALILARSAGELLTATHAGTVALLTPDRRE